MNKLPFIKMHGLGNDFVVIDTRAAPLALGPAQVRRIAERRRGVGCDQVIVIAESEMGLADAAMRIFNADGGEVGACGNAARCVARLLMAETGRDHATIETEGGIVDAAAGPDGAITVDLGVARTGWRDIPLAEERDTLHLGIAAGPLRDPVAVSMGNPHAVFFVADAASVDLAALGPKLERHPIFPERANIEVAQVLAPTRLRLRVWERGTGITPACGTGACATLVAAMRRGLAERRAEIVLDGGSLLVEWLENGHVLLTGPAETSFSGHLDTALLAVEEAAP